MHRSRSGSCRLAASDGTLASDQPSPYADGAGPVLVRSGRIERVFVVRETVMEHLREQAAVLALTACTKGDWYKTASLIEEAGSALRIVDGQIEDLDWFDHVEVRALGEQVTAELMDRYLDLIRGLDGRGISLVTVLDDGYPENLRHVFNRPPFLFTRGELTKADERAIAVVGTRSASEDGLKQARRLAQQLVHQGFTVVSGLARGIDSAAHAGALDTGGRTIAVFGTGIHRIYPPEHRDLARRILTRGAHVSQFWPDAPPAKFTFPMRNAVTSGMALGTVVVEAHGRSGARLQARICLEHGKRLFLARSLVLHEPWAQSYAEHPATTVIDSVDDVLDVVTTMVAAPPAQLTLG
jgi:DNA processing protein